MTCLHAYDPPTSETECNRKAPRPSGVTSRVAGVVSSSGFSRKHTVKRTSTVIINRLQKAGYEHNSGVIIYEHNALYCENTEVQLSSIIVKWTKKLNG